MIYTCTSITLGLAGAYQRLGNAFASGMGVSWPSSRHGCRRSLFIPPHRFGRRAVVFHLTTLEVNAALADFAEEPAGVADKQKRAAVFDESIHTPATFFLKRGIAHGKSLGDNQHFRLEKRGHVQAPIFPSATRACSASNCMR
jgi:hypothetical protein